MLLKLIILYLLLHSSIALLASNELNISTTIKTLFLFYSLTSKSFFEKTFEIPRLLLIVSKINLEKIPNIN